MKVEIIIPTFNERGNIIKLYKKIKKIKKNYKILFIDDSSKDGTINEIRSIIKIDKSVILKVRKIKDGIGSPISLL